MSWPSDWKTWGCPGRPSVCGLRKWPAFSAFRAGITGDVSQLSGGQKQLLNLASIMAMQPEILILDEPTGQLDPIAASDFLNTLKKINQELGTTVLITEHRAEDIFPVADRVLVMEKGCLVANNGPRQIGQSLFDRNSPLFPMLPAPMRVFYQCAGSGQAPLTVPGGPYLVDGLLPGESAHGAFSAHSQPKAVWGACTAHPGCMDAL